ncbi:MAG: hypothetical protein KGI06_00570 [Candidatus Micrarchaeota archaeon]|nr:hypothetical protein [Candidatus Micrarchaeota archaeon]
MDHRNLDYNIKQEEDTNSKYSGYIMEDGKKFRVPYNIIKKAVFTGLKKEELIDIPHAARLQYRLMLMDPVIKATVDFTKSKITVLYNPRDADNMKEKISIEELRDFLEKQGIHTEIEKTSIEDYDYYKDLYSYAYTPPSIRERVPYGYTTEEWKGMRASWQEKLKQGEIEKQEKFRKFREEYLDQNPELVPIVDPSYKPKKVVAKTTLLGRIFGKKKTEKGFWFHGV